MYILIERAEIMSFIVSFFVVLHKLIKSILYFIQQ